MKRLAASVLLLALSSCTAVPPPGKDTGKDSAGVGSPRESHNSPGEVVALALIAVPAVTLTAPFWLMSQPSDRMRDAAEKRAKAASHPEPPSQPPVNPLPQTSGLL